MNKYLRSSVFIIISLFLLTGTVSAFSEIKQVNLTDYGFSNNFTTSEETVSDFLKSENITIDSKDKINYPLDTKLPSDHTMKLEILRALSINVVIDGKQAPVFVSSGATASVLISQLEAQSKAKYFYDGKLSDKLSDGQTIRLRTINEQSFAITEKIPYKTEVVLDEKMTKGKAEIVQKGEEGERQYVSTVKVIDGVTVKEVISDDKITKAPVTRIIKQGVKPFEVASAKKASNSIEDTLSATKAPKQPEGAGLESDETGGVLEYVAHYTMTATAYNAGPESTGKSFGDRGYGVTASGMRAQYGVVAVDPNVIPLGTRLYIDGYGEAIAGDTGSAIKGKKIDLFFESYDECIQFGRRKIEVYVLAD